MLCSGYSLAVVVAGVLMSVLWGAIGGVIGKLTTKLVFYGVRTLISWGKAALHEVGAAPFLPLPCPLPDLLEGPSVSLSTPRSFSPTSPPASVSAPAPINPHAPASSPASASSASLATPPAALTRTPTTTSSPTPPSTPLANTPLANTQETNPSSLSPFSSPETPPTIDTAIDAVLSQDNGADSGDTGHSCQTTHSTDGFLYIKSENEMEMKNEIEKRKKAK